jgi:catechol 2,3-dioxygenase-like lactoylglutathione lyase family enzyme
MLKISHVVYKVTDLDEAVARYRDDGFDIDYGRGKNPYNALVYFADGSYLELLGKTRLPGVVKIVLRLVGNKGVVTRLDSWDAADDGPVDLSLEAEVDGLDNVKQFLDAAEQGSSRYKSGRTEPNGRVLKFVGLVPDDMQIPFVSSYNTDMRREGFVHPNGAVGFKRISFGTSEELQPLVEQLCPDERLKLFVGNGVKDLQFEYAES